MSLWQFVVKLSNKLAFITGGGRGIENIVEKTGQSADNALSAIKELSPQNRLITPEEVAEVALLLASEEGRGINGQAINVDGGTVLF